MPCTASSVCCVAVSCPAGGLEPCPWGRQDPRCCDESTAGLEHPHGKGKQTHGCHHLSVSQSCPVTRVILVYRQDTTSHRTRVVNCHYGITVYGSLMVGAWRQ